MDVYKFDGFRFDGVTSMIYHDHGICGWICSCFLYFGLIGACLVLSRCCIFTLPVHQCYRL